MHRQHHVRAVHARVVLPHAVPRLQRTKQAAQLGPVELACVDEAMPIEQRLAEQQQAWAWSAAILILGASRGELLGPPRASAAQPVLCDAEQRLEPPDGRGRQMGAVSSDRVEAV